MNEHEYILEAIRGVEKPVLVNVGAERGDGETTDFCRMAPHAAVYSIEADPRTYKLLESKTGEFPNLKTFNVAISNNIGTATFHLSGGPHPNEPHHEWTSASSLISREKMRNGQPYPWMTYEEIEIPTITLDAWAEENGVDHIDFIWIDIEGATPMLIEGGRKILAKTKWFYTEAFDWQRYDNEVLKPEIIAMLPEFEFVGDFGIDIILKHK